MVLLQSEVGELVRKPRTFLQRRAKGPQTPSEGGSKKRANPKIRKR